ncbi:hypothetical protein ILYODFUR_037814 [Ilyodon furcidens]|uniref:Secreted protein n=1 Tax=Ilyodon furcidens TaxID=33524 RepID=A0ABV0SSG3_9TELE
MHSYFLFHFIPSYTFVSGETHKPRGDSGRGSFCNCRVASLNPRSVCLSRCVCGQDTSPSLLLMVVRGLGGACVWQPHSVSLPQGNGSNNVSYHCLCVNVCMNGG